MVERYVAGLSQSQSQRRLRRNGGRGRGICHNLHSLKPHAFHQVSFKAFLRMFYSDLSYISITILLSCQLGKERTEEAIRRKWRLLTATRCESCSLTATGRTEHISSHGPFSKKHTPSCNFNTTYWEVLFLKSKTAESYANDPEHQEDIWFYRLYSIKKAEKPSPCYGRQKPI